MFQIKVKKTKVKETRREIKIIRKKTNPLTMQEIRKQHMSIILIQILTFNRIREDLEEITEEDLETEEIIEELIEEISEETLKEMPQIMIITITETIATEEEVTTEETQEITEEEETEGIIEETTEEIIKEEEDNNLTITITMEIILN